MAKLGLGTGLGSAVQKALRSPYPLQEYSLKFDGHTDYVTIGTALADSFGDGYSGGLTISMWFMHTGVAGGGVDGDGMLMIADSGDWTNKPLLLRIESDKIYVRTMDSSSASFPYTETNVWRHLTIVCDRPNEVFRMYLDGVLKNDVGPSSQMAQDLDIADMTTYIGVYSAVQYAFDGYIDEVGIFNRSLVGFGPLLVVKRFVILNMGLV